MFQKVHLSEIEGLSSEIPQKLTRRFVIKKQQPCSGSSRQMQPGGRTVTALQQTLSVPAVTRILTRLLP